MAVRTKKARSRRGRHEGSVFQRSDGRWSGALSIGKDANKKRIRKTVYGATKQAVLDELDKHRADRKSGKIAKPSKMTLGEFLTEWSVKYAPFKPNGSPRRESTLDNYRRVLENHVIPNIGSVKLNDVDANTLEWCYSRMRAKGSGLNPPVLAHAVLQLVFRKARKLRLIAVNPFSDDSVDAPQAETRTADYLREPEARKLRDASTGTRMEGLINLALGSGMREGELFGLQWSEVDFEAGTVTVKQSLTELSGKLTLTPPKSKASFRTIKLPRYAVEALEAHRRFQMAAGHIGAGYVFTNLSGGPLRRSHFHRESYKPLLKQAGIRSIRFHDLRHTHAALCLLAGESMKVISDRLGHGSIAITDKIYAHVLEELRNGTAAKLDSLDKRALA